MGEHLLNLTPTTVRIINHNKLTLAGLSQLGLNIHTLQQKKKTLYYNYMQMIPKCSYKSTLLLFESFCAKTTAYYFTKQTNRLKGLWA